MSDLRICTGIGSRSAPVEALEQMWLIGFNAARAGYLGRSGAAEGCDTRFEAGVIEGEGNIDVFLPWKGFGNSKSPYVGAGPKAREIASAIHPYWNNCKDPVKKLMGRNVYQVLGWKLDKPASMIVCWTPDGCISHEAYLPEKTGGTGLAIALASKHNIPVYNLKNEGTFEKVLSILREYSEMKAA